jgi:hypothetical protein
VPPEVVDAGELPPHPNTAQIKNMPANRQRRKGGWVARPLRADVYCTWISSSAQNVFDAAHDA